MEISAQSIQTVGGQSGPLQSFVASLKPGDTLAAQVLGRDPSGLAIISLAGKQVQVPLPQSFVPGTLLTLTVQQGANGMQFAIEAQPGQPGANLPPPPASQSSPTLQPGAPSAPGTPTQPGATPAAAATARAAAPAASSNAPLAPLINARTGMPVPAPLNATPGQTVSAQVLSAPRATTVIVSLGNQELPVNLPTPAAPGTTLALVVQRGPDGLQLAHAPSRPGSVFTSPPAPASAGAPPAAQANTQGTAVPGVAAAPAAPAAILNQATLTSLGNQNSLSALVSSVLRLGERTRDLPDEAQRALGRLTQSAMTLDGKALDAGALQRAIARSGVFLESQLAAGKGDAQVQTDIKALLLTIRRALGDWLGPEARATTLAGKPPPPPQPGAMPRAPALPPALAMADDATPQEIGRALLSQTDAALSRLRLHQIASMPDRSDAPAARHDVRVEIPVVIGQQPTMMSLVISPDEDNTDPQKKKKTWRVQFAVNASVIGEVGAEVGQLGDRTNVVLSAAEPETAEALHQDIEELSEALEAAGLTPGVLRVRRIGAPPKQSGFEPVQTSSGKLLDRDT